jgi:sigma-B regulation protein RsbU (phosphoserine phosphatase)
VLRRLNHILTGQLRGQFVSASYLWIDTEIAEGLYSAAGHPPLLRLREGNLKRIESNGLLLGVRADCDYPVCHMPLNRGDRFLVYTDGVVESENSAGDIFGDRKLEEVIQDSRTRSPLDAAAQLMSEIGNWQSASLSAQQDDITLMIIDVI